MVPNEAVETKSQQNNFNNCQRHINTHDSLQDTHYQHHFASAENVEMPTFHHSAVGMSTRSLIFYSIHLKIALFIQSCELFLDLKIIISVQMWLTDVSSRDVL